MTNKKQRTQRDQIKLFAYHIKKTSHIFQLLFVYVHIATIEYLKRSLLVPSTSSNCVIKPKKMSSKYEEAVRLLNGLQSNAATIKKMREQRDFLQTTNLPICRKYLETLNISRNQIDNLNIIHVSGTKGKGSTCAFVERILRDAGFKTGLYTSPHLVHVRERIRLNGEPVNEELFSTEFFKVYSELKQYHETNMPAYFKFLTLMAFQIFTSQKVDVAIFEVGIGGEYDCTNVIDNPIVCGITTLDYDHISILGSKLSEIAWHKSGIFKNNVPAFYTPTTVEAEEVIKSRAVEKNVPLYSIPPISSYTFPREISTGISGRHQLLNVSLALQLVNAWFRQKGHSDSTAIFGKPFEVPTKFCDSIEKCQWPGRSQIIETNRGITYLLDGAHTPKSMEACAEWADMEMKKIEEGNKKLRRILLFQCTADRCPTTLIPFLKNLKMSQIISCPTQLYPSLNQSSDSTNLNTSRNEQLEKSKMCLESWKISQEENVVDDQMRVFDCISNSIDFIENSKNPDENVIVLVTGSLHLVGGVIGLLEKIGK
ncbi:unnamed protein product [Caenorhabditis angaria]|uniref:Folylpolyglutamate synthase n=1 Tax=Caenorhabditis angaria TaxID=860376 RepID=A0A9P1IJR4_9PELO|nr:unnamed protein product [Caenorhabditis angaria]